MPYIKQPIKPTWWKESSVYQVYPASFKDSNGDGLGDIPGITSKLDHIHNLGADIVWLSPILKSPQVDMGYDISDYKDIHPPYGTLADHDALIKGLHDRGMKYVMDLVVNHTSDQHPWFLQSRSSKDNPFRDWYYWRPARYDDQGNRIPPNNWEAAFSGSAWEWDEGTQEYYLHLFAVEQPDLNWENPKVVEAVHDIIRFWLERGVDGFRMDVINFISKTFGLPDATIKDPKKFLQGAIEHFSCGPRLHEFLQGIGSILKEFDAFSVGEMPGVEDVAEVMKGVGQDRGELGMAFQFEAMRLDSSRATKWLPAKFEPRRLKEVTDKWQSFMLSGGGWNALYMENHDQGRSISRFASDSPAYRLISSKLMATYLALQSGTVFIYQGQELAQPNMPRDWPLSKHRDIELLNHWNEVLRDYPNDKQQQQIYKDQIWRVARDNARTPIQWTGDAKTAAGFLPSGVDGQVKPWIDIHPDFAQWNAANMVDDPDSSFHFWKNLLKSRKEHKDVFVYGDWDLLDPDHPTVMMYLRSVHPLPTTDKETGRKEKKITKALVILNFGGEESDGWYRLPDAVEGYVDGLTDMVVGSQNGIVPELRNYKDENETKVDADGKGTWIKLRPYECMVALA